MTELIVALDLDDAITAHRLMRQLHIHARVQWFKIGARALLAGVRLKGEVNRFLDLKLYDTRDTVAAVAARAFGLGIQMLTVHATPRMLDAAMAAKTDERQKVLAVRTLTDSRSYHGRVFAPGDLFDGIVCPAALARWYKDLYPNKLIVCPGIRPAGSSFDNHINPSTPAEARGRRADYIVVGRPILNADDPVAAAIAIMKELDP